MIRFYLRFTLLSLGVILIGLMLVRARPYDDRELRQLLTPEDCPTPCFMGIQPGVTSISEAMRMLQASGWVAEVRTAPFARWIGVIWNTKAPNWFLKDNSVGLLIAMEDQKVEEIHLSTALRVADAQLLLGRATSQTITVFRGMGSTHFTPVMNYAGAYPNRAMLVAISQTCNGQARLTLNSPFVVLRYYAEIEAQSPQLASFNQSKRDILNTVC